MHEESGKELGLAAHSSYVGAFYLEAPEGASGVRKVAGAICSTLDIQWFQINESTVAARKETGSRNSAR